MSPPKPKQPRWMSFRPVSAGSFGRFFNRKLFRGMPAVEIAPGGFREVPSQSGLSVKKVRGEKRTKYFARGRSGERIDFITMHLYEHAYMMAIKDRMGFDIHTWSALSVFEEAAFPLIFQRRESSKESFNQFKQQVTRYTPDQLHHMLSYSLNFAYNQFRDPRYFYTALLSIHRSAQVRPLLEELNRIQTVPDIGLLRGQSEKPRVDSIVVSLVEFLGKKANYYNALKK